MATVEDSVSDDEIFFGPVTLAEIKYIFREYVRDPVSEEYTSIDKQDLKVDNNRLTVPHIPKSTLASPCPSELGSEDSFIQMEKMIALCQTLDLSNTKEIDKETKEIQYVLKKTHHKSNDGDHLNDEKSCFMSPIKFNMKSEHNLKTSDDTLTQPVSDHGAIAEPNNIINKQCPILKEIKSEIKIRGPSKTDKQKLTPWHSHIPQLVKKPLHEAVLQKQLTMPIYTPKFVRKNSQHKVHNKENIKSISLNSSKISVANQERGVEVEKLSKCKNIKTNSTTLLTNKKAASVKQTVKPMLNRIQNV